MAHGEPTDVTAIRWSGDARTGHLALLDQRGLPDRESWIELSSPESIADAIRSMVVRGAPAIGLAGAYGLVCAARVGNRVTADDLAAAYAALLASRPTAVNLRWSLDRLMGVLSPGGGTAEQLLAETESIRREDLEANLRMGDLGAALVPHGRHLLTICNTGSLATAGYGTALGIARSAWRDGRIPGVLACETRPYLQGARLTLWELQRDGVDVALVTDGMAGHFMQRGEVGAVVVGADRIAANGDTANKIGTYGLAVLARHHGLPFIVAASCSTIDPHTPAGGAIPIEERSEEEVLTLAGIRIAPPGAVARHPAFDVTPAELVTAIVTERGVVRPPFTDGLAEVLADSADRT